MIEQYPNPVSRVSRESYRSFATTWQEMINRLLTALASRCSSTETLGRSKVMPSDVAGLFASPTNQSPPQVPGFPRSSANNHYLSSTFCSAESLCASNTPPMNRIPQQQTLPRSSPHHASPSPQNINYRQLHQQQQNSPSASNTSSMARRSGCQPSFFEHLRQLRRHVENLSAMDGAVSAFSTGNGPLNSTSDLMLQAQFVAEQSRTICRLSTTTACQLPNGNAKEHVLNAIEKALAATGRLEAVLAMPPPIVPTAPPASKQSAGIAVKNERVIASCHSTSVAVSSCVSLLLQASLTTPQETPDVVTQRSSALGNASSQSNISGNRLYMNEYRNYASPGQLYANVSSNGEISGPATVGRRPWYSRSAANLAPVGAHPLSVGGDGGYTTPQRL